jgi:hypothetical protein
MIRMSQKPELSTGEVLAGFVERVTYHNAENGFLEMPVLVPGVCEEATG